MFFSPASLRNSIVENQSVSVRLTFALTLGLKGFCERRKTEACVQSSLSLCITDVIETLLNFHEMSIEFCTFSGFFVSTDLYFTGTKMRTLAWHQTHSCSHRLAEAAGNVITCPQIWVKWISLSLWQPPSSTPPLFASRVWGDNELCCHAKPARDTSWAFQLLQFSPADNFETDWESRNITASYWFESSIITGDVWMICTVTLLHDNLVGSFWTILMHDTQHILTLFFFLI